VDKQATRLRVERLMDERVSVTQLHDNLLAKIESREDKQPTDVEEATLTGYRTTMVEHDREIAELGDIIEQEDKSAATSRVVRAHLAGQDGSVQADTDGNYHYRTYAGFARDELIKRYEQIAVQAGGPTVRDAAKQRLEQARLFRAPVHTLSSDVDGLQPPQHVAQILEVIDRSRPVITSSRRVNLERGQVTFPHVDQKPEVLLQGTEKTEGGTANMQVSMETITAQTFLGGGNLSWQAIEWSTPDALQLWFDMAAEQYARKTEGTACSILTACGTANRVGTADRVGTASTFADWLGGVVAGFAEVYDNSGAMANTLYLSPDMFFLAAALTSDAGAVLIQAGGLNLAGLSGNIAGVRVVTSYGFAATTAIVGDSNAFLVAESANAPVQLRATEPAIGGMEVGIIGAMAAACYDDNRFAQIT
jgi:hypothetical protein